MIRFNKTWSVCNAVNFMYDRSKAESPMIRAHGSQQGLAHSLLTDKQHVLASCNRLRSPIFASLVKI
jgi:hypothetical protein